MIGPTTTRRSRTALFTGWWPRLRMLIGAAVLAVVIWRVGAGPFLDGLRSIDAAAVLLAVGLGAITTVSSAWRWSLVARGLGLGLRLPAAVAACYRSQFLNTALPGGVLGDVHRGVRHGRQSHDVGRGLRAVGWERVAGQVIFVVLAVVVLLTLPSPVRSMTTTAVLLIGTLAAAATLAAVGFRPVTRGRVLRTAAADIRAGLLVRSVWPTVVLTSVIVVVGHLALLFVALRITGISAPSVQLLPIAVLLLLAMVVPLNIGGWGPREGMAAWAFGAAGLGAAQGVAAASAYGMLALIATLPGAVVLLLDAVQAAGVGSEKDAARG